ncbi:MAG: reverse transcriptase N-terminal domain-containing protein [Caldilinea sp.]
MDWAAVQRTVRRLQVRIVKAAQAGEWHKVRSLQSLLANSFEELLHKQFPANHQKVHLVRYADTSSSRRRKGQHWKKRGAAPGAEISGGTRVAALAHQDDHHPHR